MNPRTIVSVEDVMTPEPVLLRHDDSLPRAARTLEEYEISGAPVVDGDGALVGVLSESDLVGVAAVAVMIEIVSFGIWRLMRRRPRARAQT